MPALRRRKQDKPSIPIAPMIDAVFLLLCYFMVTSSLEKQEADIAFELPGVVEQSEPLDLPDEQIIEIDAAGQVRVNDYAYDRPASPRYQELAAMLTRFRLACEANKVESMVTIAPHEDTTQQMIVKVMDAISYAGIEGANFALLEE